MDQSQSWLKPPAVLSPPPAQGAHTGPLPSAMRCPGHRALPARPGRLTAGGGRASGRAAPDMAPPPHLTHRPTWRPHLGLGGELDHRLPEVELGVGAAHGAARLGCSRGGQGRAGLSPHAADAASPPRAAAAAIPRPRAGSSPCLPPCCQSRPRRSEPSLPSSRIPSLLPRPRLLLRQASLPPCHRPAGSFLLLLSLPSFLIAVCSPFPTSPLPSYPPVSSLSLPPSPSRLPLHPPSSALHEAPRQSTAFLIFPFSSGPSSLSCLA